MFINATKCLLRSKEYQKSTCSLCENYTNVVQIKASTRNHPREKVKLRGEYPLVEIGSSKKEIVVVEHCSEKG